MIQWIFFFPLNFQVRQNQNDTIRRSNMAMENLPRLGSMLLLSTLSRKRGRWSGLPTAGRNAWFW
jgi:hypothetical protein